MFFLKKPSDFTAGRLWVYAIRYVVVNAKVVIFFEETKS